MAGNLLTDGWIPTPPMPFRVKMVFVWSMYDLKFGIEIGKFSKSIFSIAVLTQPSEAVNSLT